MMFYLAYYYGNPRLLFKYGGSMLTSSQNDIQEDVWYRVCVQYFASIHKANLIVTEVQSGLINTNKLNVSWTIGPFRYLSVGYYGNPIIPIDCSPMRLDNVLIRNLSDPNQIMVQEDFTFYPNFITLSAEQAYWDSEAKEFYVNACRDDSEKSWAFTPEFSLYQSNRTVTATLTNQYGSKTNAQHVIQLSPKPQVVINGAVSLCTGDNILLDAGPGYSSYLWSTGETTQAISVSPAETASYTVTVTNGEGCSGTSAPHQVTVNALPTPTISGPVSLCVGGSVVLDAGVGYSSYLWSTGETTQAISVSPAETTAYTVTVTNGEGCSGTSAPHQVTVNALPTPTISGPVSLCVGGSVVLDAGVGYSSYLWSTGETTQAISVSPAETTAYTVTVTNGEGCSGTSAPHQVTVNALPTPTISGPVSLCVGGSVVLDAGVGYSSYLWSTGETTQAISVSPAETTAYTVTVTNGEGCSGTSAPHQVTVNALPTPTISGPVSLCVGGSVVLDAGVGYSSYLWSTGETTQAISVSPAETTAYTVTVTNGEGCSGTSAPHQVTVNALPTPTISGPVSLCVGGSVVLDAGVGYSSYLWSTGETTQAISVSPAETTAYTVTVTNGEGCSGTSAPHQVTVNALPTPTISGPVSLCVGGSVVLDAGVGYSSYLWSTGETTQAISVSPAETTAYTVTVTNGEGCSGTSAPHQVTVNALPTPTISGPVSLCVGGSVVLDAGVGYSSYLWSTGETTQAISVSPAETTAYTVTVTNGEGCSGTSAPHQVTVNALPTPTISGPVSLCVGGSVVLDAGVGYSSYLWSTGETTQAISVSPAETTAYTVTVTNGEGCSGTSAPHQVTVNALPTPTISGPVSLCVGGSVVLDAGVGYSSYLWSTGETTQAISVSPAETTAYTVTVTNGEGCSGTSAPHQVTVNALPTPTISGPVSLCVGGSVVLDAGVGYSSYLWSTGETTQAISVSPAETTAYTVTVTTLEGCSGTSDPHTVEATVTCHGDLNGDGVINSLDLVLLSQYICGNLADIPAGQYTGDCNLDGQVNATDLAHMIRTIL